MDKIARDIMFRAQKLKYGESVLEGVDELQEIKTLIEAIARMLWATAETEAEDSVENIDFTYESISLRKEAGRIYMVLDDASRLDFNQMSEGQVPVAVEPGKPIIVVVGEYLVFRVFPNEDSDAVSVAARTINGFYPRHIDYILMTELDIEKEMLQQTNTPFNPKFEPTVAGKPPWEVF
jgi:hypothetical protein